MTFNIKSSIKQLVRTFAMFVTLSAALTCSMHASADQGNQQSTQPLQLQVFFVSAILQRADDATTLKLVHGMQSAPTSAEAEQSFVKLVKIDFPGNSVFTMLTSSANSFKPAAYGKKGKKPLAISI